MNTKELDSKYIANTYARFPIVLERGKGSLVWDSEGREYIDMGSGIAVNAFGLADGQWMAAVTEQLGRLQHSSNPYYTVPDALLAEQLCERTGMKKVFFAIPAPRPTSAPSNVPANTPRTSTARISATR